MTIVATGANIVSERRLIDSPSKDYLF